MAANPDPVGTTLRGFASMPSIASEVLARVLRLEEIIEDRFSRIEKRLPPLLVSQDEAAKTLNVSRSTIKRMVVSGELPHIKIGRLVRVDLSGMRPLGRDEISTLAAAARSGDR